MTPIRTGRLDRLVRAWDGLYRRRRQIHVAFLVLLVPYLAYFAYTRLTALPPRATQAVDPYVGLVRPAADVDRTEDLIKAIRSLGALPSCPAPTSAPAGLRWEPPERFRPTAPRDSSARGRGGRRRGGVVRRGSRLSGGSPSQGMKIEISHHIATSGEWSPSTRLHQGQLLEYVQRPDVREALDSIVRLSEQQFCLTSQEMRSLKFPWQVCGLLAFRARSVMAERQDFAKALQDLEAILRFAAEIEDDGTFGHVMPGGVARCVALAEVMHWCREYTLPANEARGFCRWLEGQAYDWRRVWRQALPGEREVLLGDLDECFTSDGRGNGWFVVRSPMRDAGVHWTVGLLNITSCFFDDRRIAERRIERQFKIVSHVSEMSVPEIWKVYEWTLADPASRPVPTRVRVPSGFPISAVQLLIQSEAFHRGTRAALGLAAYRADHGRFPERLSDLVPDYLEAAANDPFSNHPLCYRIEGDGDFWLYAMGPDGKDNGGTWDRRPGLLTPYGGYDLAISCPRERDGDEWVLVPK
ncbi:MAG: hypothetical protein JXQ73_02365 [Phycisphaerae bacterium]|nr:hypothetical protein [Phycisphaerae bacterium]